MNNLFVCSLQGLLLLFLDKRDDFANKNEEFYNPSIKKNLVTINGMPHQFFAAGLQKLGLWIDARLSTDITLLGSGRTVEKKWYITSD